MNVLITGQAGFIGYHLTKKLLNDTKIKKIFAIDNLNSYYDVKLKKNRLKDLKTHKNTKKLTTFNFDIKHKNKLDRIFFKKKIDIIVHLAAQAGIRYSLINPQSYISSNINGFYNIIELSKKKKIKKLIYASSSSAYGNLAKVPFTENSMQNKPLQLYAATKISNEAMAYAYSNLYKFESIGLRFFTVYGPHGRPDMAIYKFVKSISQNKSIDLYGKGEMLRDFTYIDDVIKCIVKIIERKKSLSKNKNQEHHQIYNIGKGSPIKIKSLIRNIEIILKKKALIRFKKITKGEMQKTYCSIDKFKKDFNYAPDTHIKDGLKSFINWYKNYKY